MILRADGACPYTGMQKERKMPQDPHIMRVLPLYDGPVSPSAAL